LKVNFRQRHREFLFKNADIVLEISIELEDMVDLSRLLKSALVKRKKKEEMRERERERQKKHGRKRDGKEIRRILLLRRSRGTAGRFNSPDSAREM